MPDEIQQQPTEKSPHISRRSIVWAGGYLAALYGGIRWLNSRRQIDGAPWPFRKGLELNEQFWMDRFNPDKRVPEFGPAAVTEERENGDVGLTDDYDTSGWQLTLAGLAGDSDTITLTMDDILKLPSHEMTTEFCCIEGWSVIQRWKGVLFRDFLKMYPPATISGDPADISKKPDDLPPYVAMETPEPDQQGAEKYFVGLDMPSVCHVQTMLCYEMNGHPLTLEHGAPLRLVIPVKYGVKNIKRIGKIAYMTQRPRDYWHEQGYDWYAGL